MKILLLFIVFSCKACGPGDYSARGIWWDINSISTIRVYVTTQFPGTTRTRIITDVINLWNSHTQQDCGFSVQFTDDWSTANIWMDIDPTLDDIGGFDEMANTTRVCFNHTTGRLYHNECHPCVIIYIAPLNLIQSHGIDIYTVLRH